MKKIAFIITVYKNDKLEFFKQAIESIVAQDYGFENINIYLGIDGDLSQDVQSYIDNSLSFYRVLKNEQNRGLAYTLNRLIEILEGEEYVFRMDSDDVCRSDRVSKQLKAFEDNKDLMIVGSDLIEIDKEGKELREKKMPIDYEVIKKFAIARNPLNHPSVAIKKEFFNLVGLYNEEFLKSQDYELWGRALKKGIKISNVSESLLYFRVASDYINKRNASINYINEFKISIGLMIYFKMYGQFPKVVAKLLIRMMPASIGKMVYKKIRERS